jgi:L-amino acid N-acyltransferase YncA
VDRGGTSSTRAPDVAAPAEPWTDDLVVRPLQPGEARELAVVMRRSFGGLAGMMFSAGKAAFVAERGGRIVGGVTLGAFRIDAERRGGVVKWLFTLPEARGHGVASALVDRALAWFEEQDVTDAIACVEGLNAGSSNRFARLGFAPLGFVEQARRYGWRLPTVWWHANHVVDAGHVLWARTRDEQPTDVGDEATEPRGAGGLVATLGLHVAFGVIMLARLGETIDPTAIAQVTAAVVAVVGVRTAAMAVLGRVQGLRLRYLPWETGLLLAGAIALVFGGPFVAPGAVVPRSRTWSPRALARTLARMAFAGAAAVWLLGAAAWWAVAAGAAPGIAQPVLLYARILLLADVLLPFFPMTAFSGRRILGSSPVGWGALAAGTVALWLVAPGF